MKRDTDALIDQLADRAVPVRRLAAPSMRAARWLGVVLVLMALIIWSAGSVDDFAARVQHFDFALQAAGILATGLGAVWAAFHLAVPGRSRAWLLLPLPGLVLWLASSGYGCYEDWLRQDAGGLALGHSPSCFAFILLVSAPLSVALYLGLRRAAPIEAGLVSAAGGLGIAGLSGVALLFFHPFDATVMDLAIHIAAISAVIGLARLFGPTQFQRYARRVFAGGGS